ncbi:MAG: hypothetical protein K0Q70_742 [Rhodospirillales bacterium]|jgi:hypothetical protein|nr:hypothetical protein [Rhodospirillales bacterium]
MEPARPTLFLQRASGTLLKPNIKDVDVSVEDDPHESLTYTIPDPRARQIKWAQIK